MGPERHLCSSILSEHLSSRASISIAPGFVFSQDTPYQRLLFHLKRIPVLEVEWHNLLRTPNSLYVAIQGSTHLVNMHMPTLSIPRSAPPKRQATRKPKARPKSSLSSDASCFPSRCIPDAREEALTRKARSHRVGMVGEDAKRIGVRTRGCGCA